MSNPFSKEIYRINRWVRHLTTHQEKKESVNAESKGLIRAKRNFKNIPDAYTNTRWIKKLKSWKHQYKTPHQYDQHRKQIPEELQEEQDLLFMLEKKYKDTWYNFDYDLEALKTDKLYDVYNTVYNNHWYRPAERLIKKGKLEAKYYTITAVWNHFFEKKVKTHKFITQIKLKGNNKNE